MKTLLFYKKDREVLRLPLTASLLKIGRHPSNDLMLPDAEISRFHAILENREDGYWIVNQSRNGTTLNGRTVTASRLNDSDELGFGSWKIRLVGEDVWGEAETMVQKPVRMANTFRGMIGRSAGMQKVFSQIQKVAPTEATALVLGETGTGKELVAHAIHELSPRARKPFVAINCGAISPQLIESELFGHERGAFTGALQRHAGAFEQAEGGTIFLDEIGELPLELQPKLLRVLENRCFRRVGGNQEIEVNVRVIAATHRSLQAHVQQGKFREDLYFRLFSVPVVLPPLRERSEDIPLLADYFLRTLQTRSIGDATEKTFSPEAMKKLSDYAWRGNVRELRNVIMRSLLFAEGEVVDADEILFLMEANIPEEAADPKSLRSVERDAILKSLKENGWNKKKTAEVLGIAKSTLFQKIKEYQIGH